MTPSLEQVVEGHLGVGNWGGCHLGVGRSPRAPSNSAQSTPERWCGVRPIRSSTARLRWAGLTCPESGRERSDTTGRTQETSRPPRRIGGGARTGGRVREEPKKAGRGSVDAAVPVLSAGCWSCFFVDVVLDAVDEAIRVLCSNGCCNGDSWRSGECRRVIQSVKNRKLSPS